MERWAVPLPKTFRRPPPSVSADSSSALSTHSGSSFIYCSSLSRLIPHLSFGLSCLFLPPPSLAVPLSSFHSFSYSLTLSLPPSATACMAFTPPAIDLFTCNPSLPALLFFVILASAASCWTVEQDEAALDHTGEKMDSEAAPVDRKFTVVQDKTTKKKKGDAYAVWYETVI